MKNRLKIIGLTDANGAAHMSGTRVNGVCPGIWDGIDVTVYSFQAVKNLPTGDSGMGLLCAGEAGQDGAPAHHHLASAYVADG